MGETRKFSLSEITDAYLQSGRYGQGAHLVFEIDDDSVEKGYTQIRVDLSHLLDLFQKHSHEFIAKKKSRYYYVTEVC